MTDIPEHVLAQVHVLAAEGEPVARIAFLTRLSPEAVEEELRNPTITRPVLTSAEQEAARTEGAEE